MQDSVESLHACSYVHTYKFLYMCPCIEATLGMCVHKYACPLAAAAAAEEGLPSSSTCILRSLSGDNDDDNKENNKRNDERPVMARDH
mmetsp:Transcript_6330/g.12606  ORF Transcript_6330/g.12606 Transcript_6330/m.12606 type:complete len:88 (+) Transcript_6330:260-523(+)